MTKDELRGAIEEIKAVGAAPGAYMYTSVGQLCDDLLEDLPALSSPYGEPIAEGWGRFEGLPGDDQWVIRPFSEEPRHGARRVGVFALPAEEGTP